MTFTLAHVLGILGFCFTVMSFCAGLLIKLWTKVNANSSDLAAYKLDVAERYVKTEQIIQMEKESAAREERLFGSISNLTARVDRLIERIER